MARQKGVLNLEGKAGTFAFFQGREGFAARQANGMNGKRVLEDDAFARTRENGAEFGRAGKAGKLLRAALRNITLNVADGRMVGRMTRDMLKVVQSDPVNARGERTAAQGDATLLRGFEFNVNTPLRQTFSAQFEATIDRENETGSIELPAFSPKKMISAPKGASHYGYLLGVIAADFAAEQTTHDFYVGEPLALDITEVNPVKLTVQIGGTSGLPIFVVFGIEFFQIVNGRKYPLNNANHNVLSIVEVDGAI